MIVCETGAAGRIDAVAALILGDSPAMIEVRRQVAQVGPSRRLRHRHRPVGQRQGDGRPRDPRRQRARRKPITSRSIAAQSRANSSNPNCSATKKAASPAPMPSIAAASRKPTAARSSSTRSATCRTTCRSSCCACWRTAASPVSAAAARCRSTCASSPPPTAASTPRSTSEVPRGSVLPPRRLPDRPAEPGRAARGRGAVGPSFHEGAGPQARPRPVQQQGARPARIARLAGQCPRTAQSGRARLHPPPGRDGRRRAGRPPADAPRPRPAPPSALPCGPPPRSPARAGAGRRADSIHRGGRARPNPREAGRAQDDARRDRAQVDRGCAGLSSGVVAEAARLLTLQRTTLIEKMRKYGIEAVA